MSRPVGSRNATHRVHACYAGGATSAAKLAGRRGVADILTRLWVPGEGWLTWAELQESVDAAFLGWRMRKALAGHRVFDGAERTQAQIHEAQARKARA